MPYTTITDLAADTTYSAGTYYMDANHDAASKKLTLDCSAGDIIIKRNGDVYWTNMSTVDTINSTTYKVYFTVKDDDTIGDTISGSSGTPAVSGGSWNNGVETTAAITMKNWEIRWVDNKPFLKFKSASSRVFTFQYITFKNCAYSSVVIFYHTPVSSLGTSYFQYIQFDSTNTMTSTASLTNTLVKFYIDYVFVENANTSSFVVADGNDGYGVVTTKSYIKIKNSGGVPGYLVSDGRNGRTFNYCQFNILNNAANGTSSNMTFNCCLFDIDVCGSAYGYAIDRNNVDSKPTWTCRYCVFKGYTVAFRNREYGGNLLTYVVPINCCFINNTQLLSVNDLTHQTSSYNGFYNNGETYWSRGTGDFTANPSLGNYNANATIDSTWATYGPANGYVPSSVAYSQTGSDTYTNLSIDTTLYSPDGYQKTPSININPGLYYKFSAFAAQTTPLNAAFFMMFQQ